MVEVAVVEIGGRWRIRRWALGWGPGVPPLLGPNSAPSIESAGTIITVIVPELDQPHVILVARDDSLVGFDSRRAGIPHRCFSPYLLLVAGPGLTNPGQSGGGGGYSGGR